MASLLERMNGRGIVGWNRMGTRLVVDVLLSMESGSSLLLIALKGMAVVVV